MTSSPSPADVVAAATALAPLSLVPDDDPRWSRTASPTTWPALRCLDHITDALLFYAGQVSRRAQRRLPTLRDGGCLAASEHLDNALTSAHLVAATLRDLGEERAWHPSGLADAAGWAGMAITELLVHGHDVATALGVALTLPTEVCDRTVRRVFPWVSPDLGASPTLLLGVTGRVRVSGLPEDPQWWWQSAPLAEWDGLPRRRSAPPAWR